MLSYHNIKTCIFDQLQWNLRFLYTWSTFSFSFLGPHPWHMEVPGLGVESELQLLIYTTVTAMPDLSHVCNLLRSLWQHGIFNPLSEARDWTHNLPDTMLSSQLTGPQQKHLHEAHFDIQSRQLPNLFYQNRIWLWSLTWQQLTQTAHQITLPGHK